MEEEKKYLDYQGLQTYHENLQAVLEESGQATAEALDNLDDRLEDIENKDPYSKQEIDNLLEPITDKLDDIEEFAEVNVQSDWNQTDSDADDYIKNKPTSMPASDVSAWAKASSKPSYTKDEIGLSNVTNDAQVKRSEMGTASGVATLDSAGKVPSSQLPAYVDDVLEYDTRSVFPATGEGGKIYVDKSNNTSWRWSGSTYTQIKGDLTIGTTSGTAADGGIANIHYNNTSNPHSVTKAQVGLGNVVNTGDSATPVSGGTTKFTTGGAYTELAKKADKSTTLSGYGITNAYTKTEIDTIIEQSSETIIEQNKQFPVFSYSRTSINSGEKVATIVGSRPFKLYAGALAVVCFTEGFKPLINMTLNVGGTGAQTIHCYFDIGPMEAYAGSQIAEQGVNRVCLFSYTGDTWAMIGYKKGTLAELTAGTDTNGQVWSAKDLIDFFAAKTTVNTLSDEVAALKQRIPVTVMGNTLVFATDAKVSVSGTTLVIG